ncbi:MAG: hypothetical protein AB8E82_17060 [Aureispira sp.]
MIKSLSVSEKGYVKKYCAKNGANPVYLKLLDAIDNQEHYDENKLKQKFKKEKFVKQFSVAKNYLIKSIMRSLRAYHSDSSYNIQVHELLLEIEILYNKRLLGLCEKVLKKAKKIIEEIQLYHHVQELCFWEFRLYLLMPFDSHTDELMHQNQALEQTSAQYTAQLSQYRHLTYHIFSKAFKEGYSRAEHAAGLIDQYSNDPLLQMPPDSLNARALARYHNIWSKLYELGNDFEKMYHASKAFVQTIQAHPNVFADYVMSTVVPAHYNLLATAIILNKEPIFFENLTYLRNIPTLYEVKSESTKRLIHYYSLALEFQFYTQNAHFHKAEELLPAVIEVLQKDNLAVFGLQMLHIELCYSVAYAYFALGDYENSETWVDETLKHQKDRLREDIMCLAHLLHVVNHTEMGNFQYLDYKLRSTYNFILRMKKTQKFEKATLQFLKKVISARDIAEKQQLSIVYLEKIRVLENDPAERMMLKNFDLISWLESRLHNKKFLEVAALRHQTSSSL